MKLVEFDDASGPYRRKYWRIFDEDAEGLTKEFSVGWVAQKTDGSWSACKIGDGVDHDFSTREEALDAVGFVAVSEPAEDYVW